MTLKECMKKKKPYMVHEEAIGGVDGCPSSQPFLHCEKGLCEQGDKGRGSTWTSFAHTAGISRCLLRTIYRSSAAAATSAVCHL